MSGGTTVRSRSGLSYGNARDFTHTPDPGKLRGRQQDVLGAAATPTPPDSPYQEPADHLHVQRLLCLHYLFF